MSNKKDTIFGVEKKNLLIGAAIAVGVAGLVAVVRMSLSSNDDAKQTNDAAVADTSEALVEPVKKKEKKKKKKKAKKKSPKKEPISAAADEADAAPKVPASTPASTRLQTTGDISDATLLDAFDRIKQMKKASMEEFAQLNKEGKDYLKVMTGREEDIFRDMGLDPAYAQQILQRKAQTGKLSKEFWKSIQESQVFEQELMKFIYYDGDKAKVEAATKREQRIQKQGQAEFEEMLKNQQQDPEAMKQFQKEWTALRARVESELKEHTPAAMFKMQAELSDEDFLLLFKGQMWQMVQQAHMQRMMQAQQRA